MEPVSVSVNVSRPVEEVYEYLVDVANHSEFSDHYLVDWHLTREDSLGLGAGARFRIDQRGNRFPWGDLTIAELDDRRRIVTVGRLGKYNRIRAVGVYELQPGASDSTRVTYTYETEPKMPSDRIREALGGRGFVKRRAGKALQRLRSILEDDQDRGARVTISGGARKPASNFRL